MQRVARLSSTEHGGLSKEDTHVVNKDEMRKEDRAR